MKCSVAATLKQALAVRKRVKTARRTRRRKTLWRKTRVKTQARAPAEAAARRPETLSGVAIEWMVNSEEWMAASDDAPRETEAANPVPMAAANDGAGEAEAIKRMANGQTANRRMANRERWVASGGAGEAEAIKRMANVRTANRRMANPERWVASDGAGEAEATAVLTAQAAGNGAPGETEAIRRMANRERLTALGEQGQVEAPPALAAPSGAIRRAEALSLAPMERAIDSRHRARRSRK